jgi:hypothetical protein
VISAHAVYQLWKLGSQLTLGCSGRSLTPILGAGDWRGEQHTFSPPKAFHPLSGGKRLRFDHQQRIAQSATGQVCGTERRAALAKPAV